MRQPRIFNIKLAITLAALCSMLGSSMAFAQSSSLPTPPPPLPAPTYDTPTPLPTIQESTPLLHPLPLPSPQ